MDFPQPNPPPDDLEPDIRRLLDAELTGLEYTVPRYLGPDFNDPDYAGAQPSNPGYTSPGYAGLPSSSPRPTSSRNAGSQPSGPEYSYVEYADAENTTQLPASSTHTGLSFTAMLEPSPPPTRNAGFQPSSPEYSRVEHTGVQGASPLTTLLQNLEHAGPSYPSIPDRDPLTAGPKSTGLQPPGPEHSSLEYTGVQSTSTLMADRESNVFRPPDPEYSCLENTDFQNTSPLLSGPGNTNPQPANLQNEVSRVAPAPGASSQSSKPHDLDVWAGLWNSEPDLVSALDQVVGSRPGDPQPPETTIPAVYPPMVQALVHRLTAVDLEAFGRGARGWETALAEYTPTVDAPVQRVQDWIILHCRIFFTSWIECEAVARACP
ncbi:hypothetical protein CTA2_5772 [Colletotrichum tanaceti]|uniref:Uncharacterized protein n=1 Tax=Colletotrichum tanaceti TaxID=1306861 RepID=A0A4V6Y9E0_9PEZI|nr:hypothetical protein CTA2_5772 [Colletotrichum tanaceti]TKW51806.1 hypothetical protein CTA1_1851 [Colletotrichum tanaceti]